MKNNKKELSRRVKELMDPRKEEKLKAFLNRYLQPYTFKQVRRREHSIIALVEFFDVPRKMVVLQGQMLSKEGDI